MSYGWQKAPREDPGAPPGGLRRLKKTGAPEAELEDEAAALPPASSSSPASPLRPPEEIKPPARGACRAEERTPVVVTESKGDDGVWGASGTRGTGASASCRSRPVLRLHGLRRPPSVLLSSPPTPAAQGDDPGEFTEPDADDGVAGATRSCGRRLVGPVIPATAPLVVAVAPLLVTLARGGAFAVGGAIFAAPGPDAEAPEGLDGEEVLPHQLKMEGEPLRQAVDPGERLPPSAQIHHAGGSGLDVDLRTTDPAAPHAQVQHLRLLHLQHARERSGKAEAAARRPTQPDDELTGVVPEVGRGKKRGRRRRRGRRTDPSTSSASALSATSSTTSPSPPSPNGRLRRRGCKGRRGALPSGHSCRYRRRTRVPPLHCRWGKETRS